MRFSTSVWSGSKSDEEHDRREDRVQVRVEAADVRDEHVEDPREAEGERRRDEEAPRHLVEVGEARARERLGEDEEEDVASTAPIGGRCGPVRPRNETKSASVNVVASTPTTTRNGRGRAPRATGSAGRGARAR
jgi:hypothetical protein